MGLERGDHLVRELHLPVRRMPKCTTEYAVRYLDVFAMRNGKRVTRFRLTRVTDLTEAREFVGRFKDASIVARVVPIGWRSMKKWLARQLQTLATRIYCTERKYFIEVRTSTTSCGAGWRSWGTTITA